MFKKLISSDPYYARVDEELNAREGRDGIMGVETLVRALIVAVVAVVVIIGWVVVKYGVLG
jgi:hypothetical protein